MEGALQVVYGFAAGAALTRFVDDFVRPGPGRIFFRDELVEKILEISGRGVVGHQPEADAGTGLETLSNRAFWIGGAGENDSCSLRIIPNLGPAIRNARVRIDQYPDSLKMPVVLQGHRELGQKLEEVSCYVDVRSKNRGVVPVISMPCHQMNDGVLIVAAFDEKAIGTVGQWGHQRTSIWPRSAMAISSMV